MDYKQWQRCSTLPLYLDFDMEDANLMNEFLEDFSPKIFWTKKWYSEVFRTKVPPIVKSACRALAYAHAALKHGGALVPRCRQAYGHALSGLRQIITMPHAAWMLPLQNCILTLSMVEFYDAFIFRGARPIALQQFENFGVDEQSWIHHARGMASIMKLEGPRPYTYGGHRLVHVNGPRLLKEAREAMRLGLDTSGISSKAMELREAEIRNFEYYVDILNKTSKTPSEISAPGEIPATRYTFEGVEFGDIVAPRHFCLHHSFIILVDEILLQMGQTSMSEALEAERVASAVEIAKCLNALDQITVSIMGMFALAFMPFCLEQALSACPPEYKESLEAKLSRWTGSGSRRSSIEDTGAN
ncbi:MAG: hypothetical protein Q9227_004517 [Pyrenula ochraceoflavens]